MKYSKILLYIPCLFIGLQSCSKDNDSKDSNIENQKSIDIETFKGLTNIDLSGRSNWNLKIGGITYQYNYINDYLLAIPKGEIYSIPGSDIYSSGRINPEKPVQIRLEHPDYFNSLTPVFPPIPNIQDQSTQKKLTIADRLYSDYTGTATSNLTDSLKHANALIDFNILDFPTGAEFYVTGPVFITPNYAYNRYKAITPALGGNYSAFVCMIYDSKQYFAEINNSELKEYIQDDTHYRFSVRYDYVFDILKIIDISKTKWSDEESW